jgi:RNA polymerase sigma factor (sigma-70 family)
MIDWDSALVSAATDVKRRYRNLLEYDELINEAWVWRLTHKKTLDGYEADEQEKRAQYRLRRDLVWHMEKVARKEKADRAGYSVTDEAFYNEALLGLVLPAIIHGETEIPQAEESEVRGGGDSAESGVWLSHVLDVSVAWADAPLTDREREALILYYGFGKSQDEVAELVGSAQSVISDRVRRGLKKLIAALGGEKPGGCPFDCECHEGRLRQRPGIHSEISGKNQELR